MEEKGESGSAGPETSRGDLDSFSRTPYLGELVPERCRLSREMIYEDAPSIFRTSLQPLPPRDAWRIKDRGFPFDGLNHEDLIRICISGNVSISLSGPLIPLIRDITHAGDSIPTCCQARQLAL
ncbi:hypothetical protein CEXT_90771 [Caerostris extrusa]|uniref:Uncharacterized protein n=1 Tax=Caerostris extrusa TaxID=172846 RepID=A0AAV4P835_CAEEX|nr:hypothetical protein CEXT_90771 [Caerostris extrusa]